MRRGLTLIEVLVTVSIIAVLIAILLPAVQYAREAARRIQCVSQIKNIGLAIHQHAEDRGMFPAGMARRPLGASYLLQILPYVEQRPLYDSLNMADLALSPSNFSVLQQIPSIFLCPSDSYRVDSLAGHAVNYAANGGVGANMNGKGDGVFIDNKGVSARQIMDGLSQTAGVSEWIAGSGDHEKGSRLGSIYSLSRFFADTPSDREAFVRTCELLDPSVAKLSGVTAKGAMWIDGGLGNSLYNHELTPNHPSCTASQRMSAITSGSPHGGGCHTMAMDGSVRFIKGTINQGVWRALGTRAGGETVGWDAY